MTGLLGLTLYALLLLGPVRRSLRAIPADRRSWLLLLALVPLALGTEMRPDVTAIRQTIYYVLVPALAMALRGRLKRGQDLMTALAILAIWLPIEFDWLPIPKASISPSLDVPMAELTGIITTLLLFDVLHPTKGLGLEWRWSRSDAKHALLAIGAFAVVGIPLGLALDFLRFEPSYPGTADLLLGLLAGYFFVALPEEVLFRGIIQNSIGQRTRRPWLSLVAASVIFGLAHLNNSTRGYGVPNWAYAGMAGLAGLCYGWAWQRSEKSTISALTHASVNAIWSVFFV
jgi:uncharacterized protein